MADLEALPDEAGGESNQNQVRNADFLLWSIIEQPGVICRQRCILLRTWGLFVYVLVWLFVRSFVDVNVVCESVAAFGYVCIGFHWCSFTCLWLFLYSIVLTRCSFMFLCVSLCLFFVVFALQNCRACILQAVGGLIDGCIGVRQCWFELPCVRSHQ